MVTAELKALALNCWEYLKKYEKNLKVQKATKQAISEKTKQFMILAFRTGNA